MLRFTDTLSANLAEFARKENLKPIDIATGAGVSIPTVYKFLNEEVNNTKIIDYLIFIYSTRNHKELEKTILESAQRRAH